MLIIWSFANLLPVDYQWFTNAIFMLLSLPIVYQSFANQAHPFYYIGYIFVVTTNYSNHMAQWNLFDVVDSIILQFPGVLKCPADDL